MGNGNVFDTKQHQYRDHAWSEMRLLSRQCGVSEFSRAELEAFVAQSWRICPHAWARVEQLQRVCREAMPAPSAGTQPLVLVPQDTAIA